MTRCERARGRYYAVVELAASRIIDGGGRKARTSLTARLVPGKLEAGIAVGLVIM